LQESEEFAAWQAKSSLNGLPLCGHVGDELARGGYLKASFFAAPLLGCLRLWLLVLSAQVLPQLAISERRGG